MCNLYLNAEILDKASGIPHLINHAESRVVKMLYMFDCLPLFIHYPTYIPGQLMGRFRGLNPCRHAQ